MCCSDPTPKTGFGPAGLFGSIVGAVIVLLIYRWVQNRRGVGAS